MIQQYPTGDDLTIRTATLDDAAGIIAVLNPIIAVGNLTAMTESWSVEKQRIYMQAFPLRGIFLVAEVEGRVVGLQSTEPENISTICTISTFVALDCQKKGVGRRLWTALSRQAYRQNIQTMRAVIGRHNHGAVAFYSRLGFTLVTTQISALIFEKNLGNERAV